MTSRVKTPNNHGEKSTATSTVASISQDRFMHRRTFADQWEFVRFAEEQQLGLDFTTPPKRP